MRAALLAGGLAITLIGGLFAYNHKRKIQKIPRQKVLQVAKFLRQQMYMTLVQIAYFVKQNASKLPPDYLRTYVLQQNSTFMKSIKQKLSHVFTQFTQEDYQQCVNKYYKDDAQIQYHFKRYQQQFQKALLGVTPEFRQQVITFLTSEKLLKIVQQLLVAKLERIKQKIEQKVTLQQMVLNLKAQKQIQKQLRSNKLKQIGLIGTDQQLASIFQFAIVKYCKMDQQFNRKYQALIDQYTAKSNQYVDRYCSFPRSASKMNSMGSIRSGGSFEQIIETK